MPERAPARPSGARTDPVDRVERTVLDNGLRVVTEDMPELRSVAVGYWVDAGSRDEELVEQGASHFLEHLLFKGTERRSALEIAEAVESVGGEMNAFTTKEYTAFYVRVLDEHLDLALDILDDIIGAPAFRPDEVESERQVILEEIHMRDDTPDDLVHELFAEALYPEHPLGREVLGTEDSIEGMSREAIATYHHEHYQPTSIVVAAAGRVDHDAVVARVRDGRVAGTGRRPERVVSAPRPPRRLHVLERPTEQAHVVWGVPGLSRDDDDRHAMAVLNHVLGGGMASRLFQEIREQRGLAYSVYSYRSGYQETGMLAVYAGTTPHQVMTVLDLIDAEIERLVRESTITARELDNAKGAMKGGLALGLESSSARMTRIGRSELTLGEIPTIDQMVADVEQVSLDDVARVVDRVLRPAQAVLAVVGPFGEDAFASRVA